MDNLKLYHVSAEYVNYLMPYADHLFHNSQNNQANDRPYIGIVLRIHDIDYFAPLSSFKNKHCRMKESLDFIKIKNYAVINLNNMFPVPKGCYTYINISEEQDPQYRALLRSEYRYIKSIQEKIRKNALNLYHIKISGKESSLSKRCNDFLELERLCNLYKQK